jgi:hypothetical protein
VKNLDGIIHKLLKKESERRIIGLWSKLKTNEITVLGSSGQIGAYLTEHLRAKGHEVIEMLINELGPEQDLTVIPNE